MDSKFISRHLGISIDEVNEVVKYLSHFIDHPSANSVQLVEEEDSSYYKNISLPFVLGLCLKLDRIEMFDPLVLNFDLQLA